MDKRNRVTKKVVVKETNGIYVSEVQEFDKPEGYKDAFKKYYPKNIEV